MLLGLLGAGSKARRGDAQGRYEILVPCLVAVGLSFLLIIAAVVRYIRSRRDAIGVEDFAAAQYRQHASIDGQDSCEQPRRRSMAAMSRDTVVDIAALQSTGRAPVVSVVMDAAASEKPCDGKAWRILWDNCRSHAAAIVYTTARHISQWPQAISDAVVQSGPSFYAGGITVALPPASMTTSTLSTTPASTHRGRSQRRCESPRRSNGRSRWQQAFHTRTTGQEVLPGGQRTGERDLDDDISVMYGGVQGEASGIVSQSESRGHRRRATSTALPAYCIDTVLPAYTTAAAGRGWREGANGADYMMPPPSPTCAGSTDVVDITVMLSTAPSSFEVAAAEIVDMSATESASSPSANLPGTVTGSSDFTSSSSPSVSGFGCAHTRSVSLSATAMDVVAGSTLLNESDVTPVATRHPSEYVRRPAVTQC